MTQSHFLKSVLKDNKQIFIHMKAFYNKTKFRFGSKPMQ